MSGHSKFANIKHKKEKNDAAKGKIFTIIGREIAVAVKEGGPDRSTVVSKKQPEMQTLSITSMFPMKDMVLAESRLSWTH